MREDDIQAKRNFSTVCSQISSKPCVSKAFGRFKHEQTSDTSSGGKNDVTLLRLLHTKVKKSLKKYLCPIYPAKELKSLKSNFISLHSKAASLEEKALACSFSPFQMLLVN